MWGSPRLKKHPEASGGGLGMIRSGVAAVVAAGAGHAI